ncbi:MAG: GNAT family N-acetyltransferase [Oscillospiraceae bacterium]|jgi:putative acetyltransferase
MDRTGYLDKLYIHNDFQGRGIAAALLRELERRAQKIGLPRFETFVSITAKPFLRSKDMWLKQKIELRETALV